MKKGLALFLSVSMLLSMAGCNSKDSSAVQSQGSESTAASDNGIQNNDASGGTTQTSIVFNIPTDPGRIGLANNASAILVNKNIYEPLWMRDGNGEMQYRLMENLEKIDDLNYIVHIRPGVYCSDGHELTAEDVLYSFQWACDEGAQLKTTTCIDLENLELIDTYSFKMPLKRVTIAIENELQDWIFTWEGAVEANPKAPAGAGPYMLKEWVEGTYITLEKNPYYSFEDSYIEEVKMLVISEDAQKINALAAGELDYLYTLPSSEIEYIKTMDDFEIYEYPAFMCQGLIYNATDTSVLSNKDARKAISYAMDSEAVIQLSYGGYGSVAQSPLNSSMVTYQESWNQEDYYLYNMDKAKEFLDVSGIDWTKESLVIATNGTEKHNTAAQVLQNALGELGVTATIENYEASTFTPVLTNTDGSWDICVTEWQIGSGNGANLMDTWFGMNGRNCSGWSNQEFTDLLSDALTNWEEVGPENEQKALEMLVEECPIYSYIWNVNVDAKRKNMVLDEQAEQTLMATGFKRVSRIYYKSIE